MGRGRGETEVDFMSMAPNYPPGGNAGLALQSAIEYPRPGVPQAGLASNTMRIIIASLLWDFGKWTSAQLGAGRGGPNPGRGNRADNS